MDRAVERTQQKNLEKTKGNSTNSFINTCNHSLIQKASAIDISLGSCDSNIDKNVEKIKRIEKDRMENLFKKQPDIFLPASIDLTLEDLMEETIMDISPEDDRDVSDYEGYNEEIDSLESACHSRRSGKGKNKIKSKKNDDRRYMEY
jgi:hypothetical protein